jgi:hypothetical protein
MQRSSNMNIGGGLAAAAAVVVLLLAAPFIAAALAITPAQQSAKAEGQAAFQCFAHACSARRRVATVRKPGYTLYAYRYYNMHGVHGRNWARCDQWFMVYTDGARALRQARFQGCR